MTNLSWWIRTRTPSRVRVLPLDAYEGLSEAGRDRVDRKLRKAARLLPTEPGEYLDGSGHTWTLDEGGGWTDRKGRRRPGEYAPILSTLGPWTRVDHPL